MKVPFWLISVSKRTSCSSRKCFPSSQIFLLLEFLFNFLMQPNFNISRCYNCMKVKGTKYRSVNRIPGNIYDFTFLRKYLIADNKFHSVTLSWWRTLSYRNQSIDWTGFYMMKKFKAPTQMIGRALNMTLK